MLDELDKNMGTTEADNNETDSTDNVAPGEVTESAFTTKRIILVILLVAVLAIIAVLLVKIQSNQSLTSTPYGNPTGFATDKNEVIKNKKYLSGELKNVTFTAGDTAGVITVQASVLDVSSEEDFIQEADRVYQDKEFSIRFDTNTQFENKTAKGLVPGDILNIETTESIYLAPDLVASRVVFYDKQTEAKKGIIGDTNELHGLVKAKNNGSLVIEAEMLDLVELDKMNLTGSFSVPYLTKDVTVTTTNSELAETIATLVVGDTVIINTAENVYENDTLSAVQVSIIDTSGDEF